MTELAEENSGTAIGWCTVGGGLIFYGSSFPFFPFLVFYVAEGPVIDLGHHAMFYGNRAESFSYHRVFVTGGLIRSWSGNGNFGSGDTGRKGKRSGRKRHTIINPTP